jgi:hypothetical protein
MAPGRTLFLALSMSTAVFAQTPPPLEPAPPPEAPARGVSLGDQQAAKRHSLISAGPGGMMLVAAEVFVGGMTGVSLAAVAGAQQQNFYPWFLLGGILFGGATGYVQYHHPVSNGEGALSLLSIPASMMAVLSFIASAPFAQSNAAALVSLIGAMHLGVWAPVLAGWNGGISRDDAMLVGAGLIYAIALTGLTAATLRGFGTMVNPTHPLLLAPAAGMLLGGLLAAFVDIPLNTTLRMVGIPLGVATPVTLLGLLLAGYGAGAATGLVAIAVTAALTAAFSGPSEPEKPASAAILRLQPVPLLIPGRIDPAIGAGLGMVF